MTNYTRIQIRRGTATQWSTNNPILAVGEQALETDTYKVKIGDGATRYNLLPYQNQQGVKGDKGDKGDQGPIGETGSFGGATFSYNFLIDTVDSDPGYGNLKLNNSLTTATQLFISVEDLNNTSNQAYLETIDDSTSQIKGHFRISHADNQDEYAYFAINGSHYLDTDPGPYYEVPIQYLSGSITGISNNKEVVITFVRTGDKGDQGDPGPLGPTGAFYVMDTKPTSPVNGQAWIDGATGFSYVYFNDGDSSQWVQTGNANVGPAGPTGPKGDPGAGVDGVTASATELNYSVGVTSAIQTQLNAKLASATAETTYAPIANATLTGTVVLPATTSIGNVSATEIGYVDGVTSAIQTQLNAKAPLASPTFTGTATSANLTVTGATKIKPIIETVKIEGTSIASAGTYNFEIVDGAIARVVPLGNFATNIRGNAWTTLSSMLAVGESTTVTLIVYNGPGGNGYATNIIRIDDTTTTVRWANGVTPNGYTFPISSAFYDAYTFTILKTTSNPNYEIYGSYTRFGS